MPSVHRRWCLGECEGTWPIKSSMTFIQQEAREKQIRLRCRHNEIFFQSQKQTSKKSTDGLFISSNDGDDDDAKLKQHQYGTDINVLTMNLFSDHFQWV